jgi:hypothetical protein
MGRATLRHSGRWLAKQILFLRREYVMDYPFGPLFTLVSLECHWANASCWCFFFFITAK